MKIKLDENMPVALAEQLRDLGHDVHTVPEESLCVVVLTERKIRINRPSLPNKS